MSYHIDPVVNDLVLTIINDGDGEQCGTDYRQRIGAAEFGLFKFRTACREYGRYRQRVYGLSFPTREQWFTAATILQNYYRAHVEEIKSQERRA